MLSFNEFVLCQVIVFLEPSHAFSYLLGRKHGIFLQEQEYVAFVELVAPHLCEDLFPMFKNQDKGFAYLVFTVIELVFAAFVDHLFDFPYCKSS